MIKVIQGDIFAGHYDAIINPANTSLLQGGGLCGAIFQRAGAQLESYCNNLGPQSIGAAVVTPAFELTSCDWIIHACGPRWQGGKANEAEKLAQVHETIIDLAEAHRFERIAIPAISTGIYGYPAELAAPIAIKTCHALLNESKLELIFVIPEQEKFELYQAALTNSNK